MPKNAVQRLQKIESELKTVLSIYDVAQSKSENDKSENQKGRRSCPKRLDNKSGLKKMRQRSNEDQLSMVKGFKNVSCFSSQPAMCHPPDVMSLGKTNMNSRKSGSAPSSTTTLSIISEPDYIFQSSLDSINGRKPGMDKNFRTKTISENFNNSDWFDCNHLDENELVMTPSKILETADRVLAKNDYEKDSRKYEELSRKSATPSADEQKNNFTGHSLKKLSRTNKINKRDDSPKKISTSDVKTKPKESGTSSRSTSPRKELKKESHENHSAPTSKSFAGATTHLEAKKDKSSLETPTPPHTIPNKIPRLERPSPGHEIVSLKNAKKTRSKSGESREKQHNVNVEEDKGKKSVRDWSVSRARDESNVRGVNVSKEILKLKTDVKSKIAEKNSFIRTRDEKRNAEEIKEKMSGNLYEREKQVQNHSESPKITSNAQEASKLEDTVNLESGTRQLSKIIEKSTEKLEKLKMSKDLALDIAKQLKDKCDATQTSNQELVEQLQKVKRDNERLNNEVRDANEAKKKLQLKIEDFRNGSKSLLLEQDMKNNELIRENFWLKAKMKELETKHKEELMEKEEQIESDKRERDALQNQISHQKTSGLNIGLPTFPKKKEMMPSGEDQFDCESQSKLIQEKQKRFAESKNEFKKRSDNETEEAKRWATEKCGFIAKIDELRSFVNERQSKVEALEKKISELEEEVQKQKQHLKQKTDILDDTNKELESIRQNSQDLEEQVKALRKNIENFDQMHQELMKRSIDYEREIKSCQEEIRKLKDDNGKLKTELESKKESVLIKDKIIEDQQETIRQMRGKSEEVKTVLKRNQSLERILNIERGEKMELEEAVERLKWRKEELKQKVKTLEGDLLLAPQEVVRDLQKTQIVLHELENQVLIKQKEWEFHLQSLIKEKEQACSVAEFATKKLMQTTSEFQKQSEAHKRLQRALAENLAAEKGKNLRESYDKVSSSNQIHKQIEMESKRPGRRKDEYDSSTSETGETIAPNWYSRWRMTSSSFRDGKLRSGQESPPKVTFYPSRGENLGEGEGKSP